MFQLLSGMIAMGYFAVALFFLRFWRTTGDRLFLLFSVSFGLLTYQRVAVGMLVPAHEDTLAAHTLRLVAYVMIAGAVVDKNRARRPMKRDLQGAADVP